MRKPSDDGIEMYRKAVFLTCCLALSLPACSDDEPEPRFDPDACSEFVLSQQLGLAWEKLNHRVALWRVRPEDGCRPDQLDVAFIGGDFSTGESADDTPIVKFAWQDVSADVEELGAARVSIDAVVGPEGTAEGSKTFERSELNLREYPNVTAVIEGLAFDTDVEQPESYPDDYDQAHGYTLEGLGATVDVSSDSEQITVDYSIRFDPGASRDRSDLNEAIDDAEIAASIDVLLLGVDDAPVHRGDVTYHQEFPEPMPFVDQEIPVAPEEERRVTVAGDSSGTAGVYGVTSFDFDFDFDTSCEGVADCPVGDECTDDGMCAGNLGEPGEYLREVRVGVEQTAYDESSGEGTFLLTGYTSNASEVIVFEALRYDFEGEMVWVQAGGGDRHSITESFDTGSTTFPLDASAGE